MHIISQHENQEHFLYSSKSFILFIQFVRRCWIWLIHSINTDIYNSGILFDQNFIFPDQIYKNLTKCMASGINISTKNTSFNIFYTFVPVWIPPNFHELFHSKLATVVCDFPCPYQMASALMLSWEFINFDFSWYIRNVIPFSATTSSHMKV